MLFHIQQLENRTLFDAYVTGGPGHAGIAVDVRDHTGAVVGWEGVDYYCAGYYGETPGTDGMSCGNAVTGGVGRMMYSYTLGQYRPTGQIVIKGNKIQDARLSKFINIIGGPNAALLADIGEANTGTRVDVLNYEWSLYTAAVHNCYAFTGYCINIYVNRHVYTLLPSSYISLVYGWHDWELKMNSDTMLPEFRDNTFCDIKIDIVQETEVSDAELRTTTP